MLIAIVIIEIAVKDSGLVVPYPFILSPLLSVIRELEEKKLVFLYL